SREDAEDVLQEVMTAAFNAILADERPINVRPWLYRIARNRSLNHLRRTRAIASDAMDAHFSDHGASTADKVHDREEFRLLVGDIHDLPETQKTALVLREMDALSYEQIAEAMETTVPSVKSLLVRARVSLAEAAEARLLSCDEVRIELGEQAEGLRRRPSPLVRRHLRSCERCSIFRNQLRHTNKALAALMPIGPLVVLKNLAIFHLGHSAGSGATAASHTAAAGAAGASSAGATGAAGAGLAAGGTLAGSGGFLSAGLGALAGKAAAGLAAAAIVTAGAVEANHGASVRHHRHATTVAAVTTAAPAQPAAVTPVASRPQPRSTVTVRVHHRAPVTVSTAKAKTGAPATTSKPALTKAAAKPTATVDTPVNAKVAPAGRSQTTTDPTVLAPPATGSSAPVPTPAPATPPPTDPSAASATPTQTAPPSSTPPTSTATTATPTPAMPPSTTPPSTTTPSTTPPPPTTPLPPTSSGRTHRAALPLTIRIGGPGS
ncbi:MAG: sigma-70 family RNA polymerase sigma factor, partial [Solirubrobacteraceae bacterium]